MNNPNNIKVGDLITYIDPRGPVLRVGMVIKLIPKLSEYVIYWTYEREEVQTIMQFPTESQLQDQHRIIRRRK